MKRKITFLLTTLLVTSMAFAQDGAGRATTFEKNGFWDNWFIGAGANANVYFGQYDSDASFMDRVTVAPSFQLGTWYSPYYGIRLKAAGMTNLHSFTYDAKWMSRNKYASAELNFMWDMTNYLLPYKSNRVYSFIPFIGAGWAVGWDYDNPVIGTAAAEDRIHSATVDAGIINRFRFSDRLALDIEISGKLLTSRFVQRPTDRDYDILGTASANLVYTFGKKAGFNEPALKNQSEIDQLNATINKLRQENTALANRPVEEKVVVKEVVKEVSGQVNEPINNVVLFSIGKSKVEQHQEVNVYNVAKYLKENSDKIVRIVGYADKATGNATINERLSRERAQNVSNLLINKYGIDTKRVEIQWEGQNNPPFNVSEWNRAVILYLETK